VRVESQPRSQVDALDFSAYLAADRDSSLCGSRGIQDMLLKYFLAWFGMMILAVLNGGLRDSLYKPHIGEIAAHQISTIILLIVFAVYFWLLASIWPIESAVQAWMIGIMWLVMTIAFEIALGRFVAGNPWSRVVHDYNVLAGRVWVVIPLWTLIGPYVFFRLKQTP
jgi:hypothetical protein